jgi:hypothetical protein
LREFLEHRVETGNQNPLNVPGVRSMELHFWCLKIYYYIFILSNIKQVVKWSSICNRHWSSTLDVMKVIDTVVHSLNMLKLRISEVRNFDCLRGIDGIFIKIKIVMR